MVQVATVTSGSKAESICNLTVKVWGNSITEDRDTETDPYTRPNGFFVRDFNEALENLYADADIQREVSYIDGTQSEVKNLIKEMQNPPEGLEKCYDAVLDLYEKYKTLTDLAINPSGTYLEFGKNKNDAILDFMPAFEKLDNQMPEKFEKDEKENQNGYVKKSL